MTVSVRQRPPPPIDRGWAWMIVLGVFIQVFVLIGLSKCMGMFVIELIALFDISVAQAVLPATVLFTSFAILSPFAVIVGEIFTIRYVVMFGSLIGFVGISISSLLYNATFFTIFFGASIGFGGACFYGNALYLLGLYFRKHRSLAMGLALSGASVGQFVLPPVIELLLENYALGGTTLIIGAFYLHGLVAGSFFRAKETYDWEALQHGGDGDAESPVFQGDADAKNDSESEQDSESLDSRGLLEDSTGKPDPTNMQLQQLLNDEHKNEKDNNDDGDDNDDDYVEKEFHANGKTELLQLQRSECEFKTSSCHSLHEVMTCQQKPMTSDILNNSLQTPEANGVTPFIDSKEKPHPSSPPPNSEGILSRLKNSMDFRVLKNYVSLFFICVCLLCFFGYMNLILFLPSILKEKEFSMTEIANILAISGVGDLIARIGMGFLADRNFVAKYKLMGAACALTGVNTLMLVFADTFAWASVHSFFYGFSGGTYVCLQVVVLVDLVGLSELARNLVVLLFIQGVATAMGQPALGALRDVTGSCDVITLICACCSILGGSALCALYPCMRRCEERRKGHI